MADKRKPGPSIMFPDPSQGPAPELPHSAPGSPETIVIELVRGLLGDQEPGSLPGAIGATAMTLPLDKILSLIGKLKGVGKVDEASNLSHYMGDHMLRDHVVVPPELERHIGEAKKVGRMAEFSEVNGANSRAAKDSMGPSPGGSPYKVKDATGWPGPEDIAKVKLRKPSGDQ